MTKVQNNTDPDQPNVETQQTDGSDKRVTQADSPGKADAPGKKGRTGKKRPRQSLKPLQVLKPYLVKYRPQVVAAIVALVAAAAATLAVPLGVRRMTDLGFGAANAEFIDNYFMMMVLVGLILALASAGRFYFVNWLSERVVADLRADVFSHLTSLSPSFFDRTHSGEVMSRLTADTTQVKAAIGISLTQALRNLIMALGSLFMMMLTSVKLTLLVVMAIPFIILPLVAYGRLVRRLSRRAQDTLAEASAYAAENLSSIRTLQAYTHEAAISKRFDGAVERSFFAARDRLKARAGLTSIAIFLVFGSIVGVLWYGAQHVLAGTMSGGTLMQFVLYSALAAGSIGGLSEVWGEIQQTAGAAERLAELLQIKSDIRSPDHPVAFTDDSAGKITFEDVSFSYPSRPDQKVLENVSFSIEPGETVAIVGPSGAGKSTLYHLMLRFYDPDKGEVIIDNVPARKAALDGLRGRIALVPQELALFAGSIKDNIRYGTSKAKLSDVKAAAKTAHADEFITTLPDGYKTVVGEHGVMLSGGQRQRIAIARAILRDAPILLLDEATSALDAESEKHIQEALETLKKGRTTLIIAHRLATVQSADRIFVMDEGRIVETGTHESLVKNGTLYARLAALQFGLEAAE